MHHRILVGVFALASLLLLVNPANIAAFDNVDQANSSLLQMTRLEEPTKNQINLRYTTSPTETAILKPIGTFTADGTAEIISFNSDDDILYIVNDAQIDLVDASDPTAPTFIRSIDMTEYGAGATNAAYHNGWLAVAVVADPAQEPGQVVFFDGQGQFQTAVPAGALPDMLTFTPDGSAVIVANEGEPNDAYDNDPNGSVTIIPLVDGLPGDSIQVEFTAFNGQAATLRAKGVRIFPGIEGNTVAADVEPEYIAVSPDSTTAFVSLQENNAFAAIDIATATVLDIIPLGYKDHSRGMPVVENYDFPELPVLGTTAGGQEILLGGLSGLWFEGITEAGTYQFATVPDRGPNGEPTDVDGDGANERPFALPDYQAQVIRFTLDPTTGEINLADPILLTQADGTPITGLPNIPGIDEEPVDLLGNLLDYDPLGADMEGIIVTEESFWMVDEYRPAIYHFDLNGVLINRYVPEGTAALADPPETAGIYGAETLPAAYANRRANRGFEAMALDTDSGILYAFIQTPLSNPDREAGDASNVIRMLGIDPTTGQPVAEYVYPLEKPSYRAANVDKIGDAVYAGNGQFYVIERDSATSPVGKKPIFLINLTGATNVLGLEPDKTLEQHTLDEMAALGINPVHKMKVTNLPSIGYLAGDKPEGLALLPDGSLAVLNDNDFGLLDEEMAGDGTVPVNPNPTPITLGIIRFPTGNQLDASNRDGEINIQNWPVYGAFQPDAIASFAVEGATYYISANEGDARDYDGFSEEVRMADLTLDETAFPTAAALQLDSWLGRLNSSNQFGDLDADGDADLLYSYGARSFTIWDEYGNLVYDSGDDFEHITAAQADDIFNSNGFADDFDNRSDDKGSEPEAVAVGVVQGRAYAFIGLERTGGVMVYDVSNPTAPIFQSYQRKPFTDQGPEGLIFIPAEDSPTGVPLVVVSGEVSATATFYEVALVAPSPFAGITAEDWANTPSSVQDFLQSLRGVLQ